MGFTGLKFMLLCRNARLTMLDPRQMSVVTGFLVMAATAVAAITWRTHQKRRMRAISYLPEAKHVDIGGE
jgi:hypothetical protein